MIEKVEVLKAVSQKIEQVINGKEIVPLNREEMEVVLKNFEHVCVEFGDTNNSDSWSCLICKLKINRKDIYLYSGRAWNYIFLLDF